MKLTEVLAVYAAVLATGNFVWTLYKSRTKHSVQIGTAIYKCNGQQKLGLSMTAMNTSSKTVHLQGFMLLLGGSRATPWDIFMGLLKYKRIVGNKGGVFHEFERYNIDDKCPVSIEPGQSHIVYISASTLLKIREDTGTSRLMACVQNQLGKNMFSDPYDFWESSEGLRTAITEQGTTTRSETPLS